MGHGWRHADGALPSMPRHDRAPLVATYQAHICVAPPQKHGTPALVFGPGTTAEAHQANESVSISEIIRCAHVIARFLLDWCSVHDVSEYPQLMPTPSK